VLITCSAKNDLPVFIVYSYFHKKIHKDSTAKAHYSLLFTFKRINLYKQNMKADLENLHSLLMHHYLLKSEDILAGSHFSTITIGHRACKFITVWKVINNNDFHMGSS
jgi:hypothetical protein